MVQIPRADPGKICPLHKQDMVEVCHACPWWTLLRGASPQGGEIDEWGCAVQWLPILLIENAQKQNQTGAAIESFRNELVSGVVEAVATAADNAGKMIDARNNHR